MKLLPRHCPDWRVNGKSGERRNLLAVEAAKLRQLGNERAGDDGADTRHRGQQILRFAPGRRAAHGVVDVSVDACKLALEGFQEPGNALLHSPGCPPLAPALGADHVDDLPAAGDEIGEQAGRLVGQRPRLGPGGGGEVGDDGGIDGVRFGAPARCLGECAHLGRVDDDERQPRGGQRRGGTVSKPPVASRATSAGASGFSLSMRAAKPAASRAMANTSPAG